MKTEYKYIAFVDCRVGMPTRTGVWICKNLSSGFPIGEVKWNGGWRQYCFYPGPNTLYSAGCLKDVQDFIAQAMEARRVGREGR